MRDLGKGRYGDRKINCERQSPANADRLQRLTEHYRVNSAAGSSAASPITMKGMHGLRRMIMGKARREVCRVSAFACWRIVLQTPLGFVRIIKSISVPKTSIHEQLHLLAVDKVDVGFSQYNLNAGTAWRVRCKVVLGNRGWHEGNWCRGILLLGIGAISEICHASFDWTGSKMRYASLVKSLCFSKVFDVDVKFNWRTFRNFNTNVTISHWSPPRSFIKY